MNFSRPITTLSIILASACYGSNDPYVEVEEVEEPEPPTATPRPLPGEPALPGLQVFDTSRALTAEQPTLLGQLGDIRTGGEPSVERILRDSIGLGLDIRTRTSEGVVMSGLCIPMPMGSLVVGETYETNDGELSLLTVDGASGSSDDDWGFRGLSDHVTLNVDEGPDANSVEVFYIAYFSEGSESYTLEGSVVISME
ncbi:MAG: hypothetical protein ACI9KE_002592 [Polyangiales bacterium]|jgi:hypothetical protein